MSLAYGNDETEPLLSHDSRIQIVRKLRRKYHSWMLMWTAFGDFAACGMLISIYNIAINDPPESFEAPWDLLILSIARVLLMLTLLYIPKASYLRLPYLTTVGSMLYLAIRSKMAKTFLGWSMLISSFSFAWAELYWYVTALTITPEYWTSQFEEREEDISHPHVHFAEDSQFDFEYSAEVTPIIRDRQSFASPDVAVVIDNENYNHDLYSNSQNILGTSAPIPISNSFKPSIVKENSEIFSATNQSFSLRSGDTHGKEMFNQYIVRQKSLQECIELAWSLNAKEALEILTCKSRNEILPRFALAQGEIYLALSLYQAFDENFKAAFEKVQQASLVCMKMLRIDEPHIVSQAFSEAPSVDTINKMSSINNANLSNIPTEVSESMMDPEVLFWKYWKMEGFYYLSARRFIKSSIHVKRAGTLYEKLFRAFVAHQNVKSWSSTASVRKSLLILRENLRDSLSFSQAMLIILTNWPNNGIGTLSSDFLPVYLSQASKLLFSVISQGQLRSSIASVMLVYLSTCRLIPKSLTRSLESQLLDYISTIQETFPNLGKVEAALQSLAGGLPSDLRMLKSCNSLLIENGILNFLTTGNPGNLYESDEIESDVIVGALQILSRIHANISSRGSSLESSIISHITLNVIPKIAEQRRFSIDDAFLVKILKHWSLEGVDPVLFYCFLYCRGDLQNLFISSENTLILLKILKEIKPIPAKLLSSVTYTTAHRFITGLILKNLALLNYNGPIMELLENSDVQAASIPVMAKEYLLKSMEAAEKQTLVPLLWIKYEVGLTYAQCLHQTAVGVRFLKECIAVTPKLDASINLSTKATRNNPRKPSFARKSSSQTSEEDIGSSLVGEGTSSVFEDESDYLSNNEDFWFEFKIRQSIYELNTNGER